MKLNLYTIQQEYISLAEQIIDAGGEVTEEVNEALQINKEQLEHKGQCYGFVVKQLESEVDIIDIEIKRLEALKKSRNKTVDKLKETISNAMQLYEIEEIKTPTLKISFRKSESVEIDNLELLDENFIVEKISRTADKALIKENIKAGIAVVGAVLKQNKNLQIK